MKNILLLPGDGIGPEIMAEAEKVLRLLQERAGLAVTLDTALLGGCAVDATGELYPLETRAKARAADAVLLACVMIGSSSIISRLTNKFILFSSVLACWNFFCSIFSL